MPQVRIPFLFDVSVEHFEPDVEVRHWVPDRVYGLTAVLYGEITLKAGRVAAGLVAVARAQVADLPAKAKPVEYVKICTVYGEGFFCIPGTDTCIKFGVRTSFYGVFAHVGFNNTAKLAFCDLTNNGTFDVKRAVPAKWP